MHLSVTDAVCLQAVAQATIEELFPLDEVSTDLDQTVVSLDKDLVDDFPASDPRWAESRQGEIPTEINLPQNRQSVNSNWIQQK